MEEQCAYHTYEKMFRSLYTYQLGAISFLELIAQFEESLGIEQTSSECERVDENVGIVRVEREG